MKTTRCELMTAHKAKMAAKRARNATMTSSYPKPQMRLSESPPYLPCETGRTLGAGGYVINERVVGKTGAREIARNLRRATA